MAAPTADDQCRDASSGEPVRLRFLKFAAVGVLNTGITFLVFNLCVAWVHTPAALANVIAWIAGFANSFVWNRNWTFADRRDLRARTALARFALVNVLMLGVSEGVVIGLERLADSTGITEALGSSLTLNGIEAVAIGCALCVNYALSSNWAFGSAHRRAS